MAPLETYLRDWSPEPLRSAVRLDEWPAAAFAAVLDRPAPAERAELPPLWHWFYFLDHPDQSELGEDGHPAGGGFLPPIPHRRRMFAGGRWRRHRPLRLNDQVTRRASVSAVQVKTGRGGELAFVTVRYEFFADDRLAVTEEQDIVYRSQPGPGGGPGPAPTGVPEQRPEADWALRLTPDPAMLFRFSALTFNAHRIHYDQPYATAVEGYPGLVVHGPLLALMLVELPRRHRPDIAVTTFSFRLRRPTFVDRPIEAWARMLGGGRLELAAGSPGEPPAITADARLSEAEEEC